jgi:Ni/Co efflux regulator RcnB
MKSKTLIAAVAALALATPLLAAPASAQQRQGQHQGQYEQSQQYQHGQRDGSRHDRRHSWRENNRDARWDNSQHNGYYRYNTWHRGPPPAALEGRRGVALGYRPWARGQRLGYYSGRYEVVDYRQQHLRHPPRGYHWVRDDSGDYLLAAIVGGLIAQVIMSNNY